MFELVANPFVLYTPVKNAAKPVIGQVVAGGDGAVVRWDQGSMEATDVASEEQTASTGGSGAGNFQREAAASIQAVRKTLSELLDSSGKQILKSRDAQKFFGVDANLSWQIFKLLSAGDLLGLAQYVPAGVSMQRVLSACRDRALDPALILAAEEAFTRFEAFVTLHAGERSRFESMAAAMSQGDEAQQADLQYRKALFRSHTHFWGIELDTIYTANLVGPNPTDQESCDSVFVSNILGFRRLRPNADTHVLGMHFTKHQGEAPIARDPLDPVAKKIHGVSVLPQFSTNALPLLRTETDEWGRSRTRLGGDAVGLSSTVDLAFGEIMRGVQGARRPGGFLVVGRSVTMRPTRRLYMDMLVHRQTFAKMNASVKMYGHASIAAPPEELEQPTWELPIREQIVHLTPQDDARLAEVPRRRELLTFACQQQGWSLDDFDLYRLHLEYPMLDTVIVISLVRPEV